MRIGFDANPLSGESGGGIVKYITKIIEFLNSKKIECFLFSQEKQKIKIKGKCINPVIESRYNLWKPYWDNFVVPGLIKKYKIDLYHAPASFGIPVHKGDFCKTVLTIHDIAPVVLPEYYKRASPQMFLEYQTYPGISATMADRVIAVSQNTKNDICKYFHIPPRKIKVIYQGDDKKIRQSFDKKTLKELQKKYGFGDNYFIYLSEIALRKNHERLIYAFAEFKKNVNKDFKLLLVGKMHEKFVAPLKNIIKKNNQEKNIIFLDYVSEKTLSVLLSFAKLMVFPSLYEGFGLPTLEAMACGCPVVCSNISSMPEIADGAAELFNPYNIKSIVDTMFKVINDDALRQKMVKKGFERIKDFSWEKTQGETFKVYQGLLKSV